MLPNLPEAPPLSGPGDVLETIRLVVEKSRQVRIDSAALAGFARKLAREDSLPPAWDPRYHFVDGSPRTVFYMLILDSLNFCFWPAAGRPRWEIDYGAERLSGYVALAAALKQAAEAGIPVLNAEYLAALTREGLRALLGGRGDLQLMEERLAILRETGRVLLEQYGGDPCRLVAAAGGSAAILVGLVAEAFPSFRDTARYHDRPVFFYKRAQILAADLHGAFGGRSWGAFRDMDRLTAFADYKLPQVLRHLGVLHYSPALAGRVDARTMLPPGSPEEVEIRANTIWAVEGIRQEAARLGIARQSYEIDGLLWNLGQDDAFREKPYHRTRTIYY